MTKSIIKFTKVSLEYSARVGLFKRFTHKAIDDVSFEVHKGDVFGVLGKNGSGKSTLLKLLAGVFEPDEGAIEINRKTTRSLLTLGLGFNNQLSGRDNALISCMLNGFSKAQARSKLEEIKEFSELDKFFEQPVKSYSSGMKSRLGFATGVVLEVDLLLIDEVLSVGDADFRKKAELTLLNKIKGEQTVVFVSHSESQIQKLCNRSVWLDKGKIIAAGLTEDVLNMYKKQEKRNAA